MPSARTLTRVVVLLFAASIILMAAGGRQTQNIVLVTADGLRWQEVFRGIDPSLMSVKEAGMESAGDLRAKL